MTKRETVPIAERDDIVRVRRIVREWATDAGFGSTDLTRIVTAASELGRNALLHGHGGRMHIELLERASGLGLRLTFEDEGPGIVDVPLALSDGFTSGRGLGLGLGGSKRLVDEFDIVTAPGKGTRITVLRWA